MKKEIIIIIILLAFIFIFKKKARAGQGTFILEYKPARIDWSKRTAKSGDFISKMLMAYTNEESEVKRQFNELVKATGSEKNALTLWTKVNAIANGYDWSLYNDKPSNNPLDPDSVTKGDKFVFFGPYTFEETHGKISEKTNTKASPVFYNNIVVTKGPNSQELSEIALEQWREALGDEAENLLKQFKGM